MKRTTTTLAVIAAGLLLAACANKEETAVDVDVAPEATPEPVPVVTDPMPAADANSADAEQSGGDKVSEPPPPPAEG